MRRFPTSLLLLILVSNAVVCAPSARAQHVSSPRKETHLLPLPKEEGVFHFVIYGDRTGGPAEGIEVLKKAVRETNLLAPDLVMTVGDLVQGYNAPPEWMEQMREYRGVMSELAMPWYPVAGNHDVYWRGQEPVPPGEHEGSYEKHFGPLYYWFSFKGAAFIVLYTDERNPETGKMGFGPGYHNAYSKEQLAWLAETLKETRRFEHVFLFMHHPRWLTLSYPGSNWPEVHRMLVDAGNVTAVFAGHIHRQRYDGKSDGIEYFTLSTTGGSIPFDSPGSSWMHHMNLVTVREGRIQVATLPVGTVIDPREMTPEYLAEMDKLRGLAPRQEGGALLVQPDASADGEGIVVFRNPTSRPLEVSLSIDAPRDPSWVFAPEHVHQRVEPGAVLTSRFRYLRQATMGGAPFDLPRVEAHSDYLGSTVRVTMPPADETLHVQLATLPGDVFARDVNGVAILDGKGACLRVDPRDFDVPQGPFTVEGRVRLRELPSNASFVAKTEGSEFCLWIEGARPSFEVHLEGQYRRAQAREELLSAGRWHHLAGVFDGGEVRLYVDGALVAKAAASGARRKNSLPLFIGADPDQQGDPVSFLPGEVDEIRISRVARYEDEKLDPVERHESDLDTLLLLHLDRPVGPFAPDQTLDGRHALAIGPVRYVAMER